MTFGTDSASHDLLYDAMHCHRVLAIQYIIFHRLGNAEDPDTEVARDFQHKVWPLVHQPVAAVRECFGKAGFLLLGLF